MAALQISTLDSDQPQLSDDQVFTSRQKAKHTCLALRRCAFVIRILASLVLHPDWSHSSPPPPPRYFEAHLAVKTERIKQSLHQSEGGAMAPQNPFYKVGVCCGDVLGGIGGELTPTSPPPPPASLSF